MCYPRLGDFAVLKTFVPIVAELEGEEAARDLARLSFEHASQDSANMFKKGAVGEAISAVASTGALEEAIAAARKLRSHRNDARNLLSFSLGQDVGKELREICEQVTSKKLQICLVDEIRTAWR